MNKIQSPEDLIRLKGEVQSRWGNREDSDSSDSLVYIKVGMATCGIASGARETMNFLIEETEHQAIDAIITKTGCLGFCYAEPTVEVKIADRQPVVFGHVDKAKAREIIEKYVIKGEMVSGIIPIPFSSIDE